MKTSSGKVLIMSDKRRILPKHTLLGGFGTGKHFWLSVGIAFFFLCFFFHLFAL